MSAKTIWRGLSVALLLSMMMSLSSNAAGQVVHASTLPPQNQIYWGVFTSGPNPPNMSAVSAIEEQAGKKMSIVPFGGNWMSGAGLVPFNTAAFEAIRQHGSIPLFSWTSQGGPWSNFTNATIASGAYDAYVTQWAVAARNWGHPFFLKFDHEMDGSWFPWGEGSNSPGGPIVNGNTPGSYVAMYRHVHDIFIRVGATNVTWVWCVNQENTTSRYPPLSQVYPGDAYVDWTGIDAYNRYPGAWQTFAMLFTGWINPDGDNVANTYARVLTVAPAKPMMVPEIAVIEDPSNPNHKAAWFRDAYITQIAHNFPAMQAILYYNAYPAGDPLRIDSSPLAQGALRNSLALSAYATNTFGQLGAGPIAPSSEKVAYLPAIADTFINSGWPNSVAGGTSPTLTLSGMATQTRSAFLRFDLSSLAGKQVDQAALQLSLSPDADAGSTATINVKFDANNSWKEQWMSWNNRGGPYDIAPTPVATLAAATLPGSPYVVVLSAPWVASRTGGQLSFELDSSSTDNLKFMAREASDPNLRPQLVVAYR